MTTVEGSIELTVRGRGRRCYVPHARVLVSRGGVEVPRWLRAAHVTVGDYVGVSFGGEWASTPAVLPTLVDRVRYGSEKRITVPSTMTTELAFLLGSYLAEGHTTRSNWSVILTNSVMEVLERAQRAWASEFGLHARVTRQPGRCTGLVVSSKRLVEFMELLDCGSRASNKRVPEPILRGTREHALAFMQGVALDAYTTCGPGPKWAICLESSLAIDGLQDVVTKLGVVNAQIPKLNRSNGKTYFELYASGAHGQQLCRLVPFLEPDKAARAGEYEKMKFGVGTVDLIPGACGRTLYDAVPRGQSGPNGKGSGRRSLRHLLDARSTRITRTSVLRAQRAGAILPDWLVEVLETDTRFSPVRAVESVQS